MAPKGVRGTGSVLDALHRDSRERGRLGRVRVARKIVGPIFDAAKLDPAVAAKKDIPKIDMTEEVFRRMHEEDKMAKEKLDEFWERMAGKLKT